MGFKAHNLKADDEQILLCSISTIILLNSLCTLLPITETDIVLGGGAPYNRRWAHYETICG